jgi:hypothetical protein
MNELIPKVMQGGFDHRRKGNAHRRKIGTTSRYTTRSNKSLKTRSRKGRRNSKTRSRKGRRNSKTRSRK